jgi:hypothetical protein
MPERCPGDHPHLYSFFKHENEFYRVREGDLFGDLSFYKNQTHAWQIQHQSQVVDSFRALHSSRRAAMFKFIRLLQSRLVLIFGMSHLLMT